MTTGTEVTAGAPAVAFMSSTPVSQAYSRSAQTQRRPEGGAAIASTETSAGYSRSARMHRRPGHPGAAAAGARTIS